MQPRSSRLWVHILASAFLLLMPVIDAPSPEPMALLMFDNPFFEIDVVVHASCILFGYLNYYLLVPRLFYRRKRVVYFIITALCLVLVSLLPQLLSQLSAFPFFENQSALRIHAMIQTRHIFYMFVMMFLLSLVTRVNLRLRQVEHEKSLAEIRYLKAQINPHFLFNTLNSIYSLIQINPGAAGKSLLKMSNVMRYILHAAETNYEPLSQAIAYLEDYIGLQQERFRHTVNVSYTCIGVPADLRIASLILVPFVENAFKYGVDPEFESRIDIAVTIKENILQVIISNTDFSLHQSGVHSSGIGVLNTRKRLELLYPARHRLDISNINGIFRVNLEMELE